MTTSLILILKQIFKHLPKTERPPLMSPYRDWKILLRVAVALGAIAVIAAAGLFFAIDTETILEEEAETLIEVEDINLRNINMIISEFDARRDEFRALLQAPAGQADPSL